VLALIGAFIYRAIRPAHINHIVLIRLDDAKFDLPFNATLVGGIAWKQPLEFQRHPQSSVSHAVGVANISHAWGDGELIITDGQGRR
jgi:hypothetical protein